MSRRCAVALAVLLVCPHASHAQAGTGTIQGVVRTESRALEGVSVTVVGTTLGALTRADGPFYFAGEHVSYINGWQAGAIESAWQQLAKIHKRVQAA